MSVKRRAQNDTRKMSPTNCAIATPYFISIAAMRCARTATSKPRSLNIVRPPPKAGPTLLNPWFDWASPTRQSPNSRMCYLGSRIRRS